MGIERHKGLEEADVKKLRELLRKAREWYDNASPEEIEAMLAPQREVASTRVYPDCGLTDDEESEAKSRIIPRLLTENERLYEALSTLRSLVKEGGVPRYTVTPGAALNAVIEEDVDPVIKAYEAIRQFA